MALLQLIRNIAFDIEANRNPFVAQVSAIKNFINIKQGFNTANDAYYDSVINNQEVLEHAGVDLGNNKTLLNIVIKEQGLDAATIGGTKKTLAVAQAKEQFDTVVILCGLNAQRYQALLDELSNAYLN